MVKEVPSQGSEEEDVPERPADVAHVLTRLQSEILTALTKRAARFFREGECGEDVSDEELEESDRELTEAMGELGLTWDDLQELGIEEITVSTVQEDDERASDRGGGRVRDPVLEAKVKEYYHREPSRDARLFLLNLYDDELGEDLWCLETFPPEEMYRQGMERLQDEECCAAYTLFSFALLKGYEDAGPLLVRVAEAIRMNDRAHGTHIFGEVKAKVERAIYFGRKVPS